MREREERKALSLVRILASHDISCTYFLQRTDYQYAVHISYMEIYNDGGYDLLHGDDITKMEDLPLSVRFSFCVSFLCL